MAKEVHKFSDPSGNGGLSFGAPQQTYLCYREPWHYVGIDDDVDISGEDDSLDLQAVDDADELASVKESTIANWGANLDSLDDKLEAAGL